MDNKNLNQKREAARSQAKREYILWLCLGIAVLIILGVALAVIFHTPNVEDKPPFPTGTEGTKDPDVGVSAEPYTRKDGFYTFLIAGVDAISGNTDVLMLASLDTENGKIEIVQIPRDTYINKTVGGYSNITRVNSIYAAAYNSKVNSGVSAKTAKTLAMQDLTERLSESLCVNIDEYVLVDTESFRDVINAVGGIDYEVPCDMFYEDPEQDLYIDLKEGFQHLNGSECEQLIRYRSGYGTGDIERIELRGDFMVEVFNQVKNKISLDSMLTLIREEALLQKVGTSMSLMDIFSYVKMCYKLGDDAISVRTISGEVVQNPETGKWIYFCLNKKGALADINECLNVYKNDIDIALFDKKGFFSGTEGGSDAYIYEYYCS